MPRSLPRPSARTLRRIGLGLLVTLVVLECAARWLESLPDHFGPGGDSAVAAAGLYRADPDPVLRWELEPDSSITTPLDVVLSINGHGFRGPAVVRGPAPEGTVRIAVLGDSETFGEKLAEQSTLPAALARALEDRGAGRVEALNFGTNGYDTRQEARLFSVRVEAYEPDAVLLYYVSNDALPIELLAAPRDLASRSALVRLVRNIRLALRIHAEMDDAESYAAWVASVFEPESAVWQANRRLVLELVRSIERSGAKAVVVIAPELYELETASQLDPALNPYRIFNEAIRSLGEDGVTVVDPQQALASSGRSPMDFWVTRDDHHKNQLANRLIAEHIATSGVLDSVLGGPGGEASGMVPLPTARAPFAASDPS